jgi:dihydroneopterin aldolase
MAELADALASLVSQTYGDATVVFLEDAIREIEVGIHEYEYNSLQPVRFDVYAAQYGSSTSGIDDANDILDYEYLLDALRHVIEMGRFGLLEHLANELLDYVLAPDSVVAASVKISKLGVPDAKGNLGCCVTRMK